ncbi:MAG: DUF937 domain-containing protein [Leptospiraceae bacterium]|nr:DUF937 domain-containing protein [Leptospiraceae bacterium]
MSFLNNVVKELADSGLDKNLQGIDVGNIAKTLLSSQGGTSQIDMIVSVLKKNGLDEKVTSWVGQGKNASISESELTKALGNGTISELSNKLGIDSSKVVPILTSLLPVIVNQLTPEGKEGGDGSLLSSGVNLLKGFL